MTLKLKLMGKKRGMTQLFDENGNVVPCTVIEAEPNVVTQIKTKNTDGYNAVQLGFDEVVTDDPRTVQTRIGKPLMGHFQKANVKPRRHLIESRIDNVEEFSLGQEVGVDLFAEVPYIDVIATSKGKGYQGVMKLYNYSGGPASHGSGFHRHAGSTGMRSTPGRCFPGGKRASHMGDDRITVQNVRVVAVHPDLNILLVEGQVPGPKNGLVYFTPATKKRVAKKKK